ncbi:MAG: MarR family transcriptional regulator [Myxococcaceae bacterium]|nr:MAG: MarR family transcriptional regulator [Myxococcaceae bacterium]
MSSSRARPRAGEERRVTPMIGALLRLPHEAVVTRMLAALAREDLELTQTELGVFLFPGPDGRRPSDLARQCGMTRQAMNYVLTGLEEGGYLQRHDAETPNGRVVRTTERGRRVIDVVRAEIHEIEREWAAHLGASRYGQLRDTLHELARWLGKLR